MGHGDTLVIADSNFPSDSVAKSCIITNPIRIHGKTSDVLSDILTLIPIDTYRDDPIIVMDRVPSDKERDLFIPAYELIAKASNRDINQLYYFERFEFYNKAKNSFVIIQTDDSSLYANIIVSKGVL